MIEGWRYYNHAMIPITAPHEKVNMKPVLDGSIWKYNGGVQCSLPDGQRIGI